MVNSSVAAYIHQLPSHQRRIAQRIRELIRKTLPEVKEEIKWNIPHYYPICYIAATKDHVNVGFCYGRQLKDPHGLLEGTGKNLRHIKIYSVKDIKKKQFVDLLEGSLRAYQDSRRKKGMKKSML